jgi:MOSC domain-containing protein YiiM
MGTLEAIWLKRVTRGPMDPVSTVTLSAGRGIVGNADQRGRARQVTIIEREVWDVMVSELGREVDPSARRANLMVSGMPLADSRGRTLLVGACRIRIRGETRPCDRMDEAAPGLRSAMLPPWRGGAFGEVLDDGKIRVGDPVRWAESPEGVQTAASADETPR